MPKVIISWSWEDAFSKWGFDDGDGPNFSEEVANVIRSAGYKVECDVWGCHNYMIMDIWDANDNHVFGNVDSSDTHAWRLRGEEGGLPTVGYDEPRDFLPKELIELLDQALPDDNDEDS